LRGEINREPHYFTSSDWVNRKEIMLSGWPINKKANHAGRLQAGAKNRALALIRRLEAEGRL
jgi:hypothetical protein